MKQRYRRKCFVKKTRPAEGGWGVGYDGPRHFVNKRRPSHASRENFQTLPQIIRRNSASRVICGISLYRTLDLGERRFLFGLWCGIGGG